ncbi:spidroin-1-like [Parasteatoda tepidariorum]|uniref:spidroin-1-like n=1 Tax=Parasteatoda tepidariorum TaxID=114398 RepID=UPI001C7183CB|nr:spidroin-1-like [Parasteatoda tepidariorum]
MLLQIVIFAVGLFCTVNSYNYGVSATASRGFSGSLGGYGGSMGGYGGGMGGYGRGMSGMGGYGGNAESYGSGGAMSKPKPYSFNYQANGMSANSFRNEEGDSSGNVQGSYGYTDVQGLQRQVQYTAGAAGFQASVKTNEPGTDRKPESPADVNMMAEPAPAGIQEKYTRRAGSGAYGGLSVGGLREHGGRGIGGLGGGIGVYGGIGGEGMGGIGGVSSSLSAGISRSGLEKIESEYQRGNVGGMRAYGESGMSDLKSGMGGYGGIRGDGMRYGHTGMGAIGDGTYGPSTGISHSGSEKILSGGQRGNVGGMRGGSRLVEYSGLGGGIGGIGGGQHGNIGVVGDGSSSLLSGISRSGSGKTGIQGHGGNVYGMGRYGGAGMAEYGGLEDGIRGNGGIGKGMGRHGDMGGISGGSSSLFAKISRSGSGKSIP